MSDGGGGYIPSWDGASASFLDFRRACGLLVIGTKKDDRGLLRGRVNVRLGGVAWERGAALDRAELGKPEGVEYALTYLESGLQGAKVSEIGLHAGNYMVRHDRRPGQTCTSYQMDATRMVTMMEKEIKDALIAAQEWKEPIAKEHGGDGILPNVIGLPEILHGWLRSERNGWRKLRRRSSRAKPPASTRELLSSEQRLRSGTMRRCVCTTRGTSPGLC